MHISLAALALSSALSVNAAGFNLPRSFNKVVPRAPSPLVSAAASLWRRQGDPQVDPVLDPAVIAPGFAQDGGNNEGQVPSQTSTNNFINFCLTQVGVELTDGLQKAQGSCNPTTVGRIIANNLMPRSKFVFPPNLDDSLVENTVFTIQMKIENLVTGNFVNPATNYYAAPQQVDGNGIVLGHSHVVIQALPQGLGQTEPLDPETFQFFKGLNAPADANGLLFADVIGANGQVGLPAGAYRMCSINSSSNHQPVLVARAQHGSLDDCSYFTVRAAGQEQGQNQGDQNQNQGDQNQNQGDQNQNQGDQNQNQGDQNQNQGDQNQNQGDQNQNQGDQNQNQGDQNQNQGDAGVIDDGQNQGQDQGQDQGQNQGQDQNNNAGAGNLQTFTGALGAPAPPVAAQGNQFQTNGQTLPTLITAIEASCNAQRNACADASNAANGQFTIPQCDDQRTQCLAQNAGGADANTNLNTFTETINQGAPVPINPVEGGQCFTDGIQLPNLQACVQRACDAQRNRCADSANGNIGPCDEARGRCLQQQPAARRA